jgi:WD40 repeat protein
MTQPSGRTCGVAEQYRTYLRSSPIFCAIDAIALVVRLSIYLLRGKSFFEALLTVRRTRFDDNQDVSFDGGFQGLERLTWVRWLIFSFGTLPQVIKLLALHGVPWTKAWGIMFFASFLVLEIFSSALYLSCPTSRTSFWNGVRKAYTLGQDVIFKALSFPQPDTHNAFRPGEAEAESMSDQPQVDHEQIHRDDVATNNGNTAVSQSITPDQAELPQAQASGITMPDLGLPIANTPQTVIDTFHDDLSFLDRVSAILAFLCQWILLIWAYHQVAQPVFNLDYLTHKQAWFISIYHPGWLLLTTFCAYLICLTSCVIVIVIILFSAIIPRIIVWTTILLRPGLRVILSEILFWIENLDDLLFGMLNNYLPPLGNSDDGTILLWNSMTAHEWIENRRSNVKSSMTVTYSPKGHLLAMGSSGNKILLWNPAIRKAQKLKGHSKLVLAVAFSCDCRRIASASADHTIIVWNLGTQEQMYTLEGHTSSVGAITFSYNNTLLASGSADTTIILWNPETGRYLKLLKGHRGSILAVAFSRNSQLLASTSDDNTVKLWNPATGDLVQTLEHHASTFWIPVTGGEMRQPTGPNKPVTAIAFSSDNQSLALASDDYIIRLWNHATGEGLYKLAGHKASIRAVAFSDDGTLLASGSDDKTVILWSAVTGKQLAKFSGYWSSVVAVSFCRDGKLLASATDDKTMRLWNVATRQSVHIDRLSRKDVVLIFFFLLPGTIGLNIWNPLYEGDIKGGLVWEFIFLSIFLRFFIRLIWYATEEQPLRRKIGLLGGRRSTAKRR